MVQYNVPHAILCLQIGNIVVVFLSGVTFGKIYRYITSNKYQESSLWEKCLVWYMLCLQALHTALVIYTLFSAILYWHKLDNLEDDTVIPYGIGFTMFVGSCMKTTVQAFVIRRAKQLSSQKCIPIICWVLIVLGLAGSLGCSISAIGNTFGGYSVLWLDILAAVLATSIAVDLTSAAVQWIYLYNRSKESPDHTKKLLDRIIMLIKRTTLVTSIPTLLTVALLLYALHRNTLAWITTLLFLPEVFTLTFFASLLSTAEADADTVTNAQPLKSPYILPPPVSATRSNTSEALANFLRKGKRTSLFDAIKVDITVVTDFS